MIWNVPDYLWEMNFAGALAFYRKNGHLDIPDDYGNGNGKSLSLWLTRQRKYKTEAKLSEEQIKRLESLEMDWLTPSEREWETHYESAKDYHQKNGPCAYVDESDFPLGMWIWRIRAGKVKLKASGGNGNQMEQLKEIGLEFSPVS